MRGNALSDAAKLSMREHVEWFPKKESHYSDGELYYLDSNSKKKCRRFLKPDIRHMKVSPTLPATHFCRKF